MSLPASSSFPTPLEPREAATAPFPRVTVIGNGGALVIYPDDDTVATLRSEHWDTVKVSYRHNEGGELEELAVIKSEDNIGVGVGVRYYENQRVNTHVTVKNTLGIAVAKRNADACPVRKGWGRVRVQRSRPHQHQAQRIKLMGASTRDQTNIQRDA